MPSLKSQEQRRKETLNIIFQIKQLGYSSKDPAIYTLIELLTTFVETGIQCDIHIPYPEINKIIMGHLYPQTYKDSVVFLRENT